MNNLDMSWAYDGFVYYRKCLRIIIDRLIETLKGIEQLCLKSKNNKLVNLC